MRHREVSQDVSVCMSLCSVCAAPSSYNRKVLPSPLLIHSSLLDAWLLCNHHSLRIKIMQKLFGHDGNMQWLQNYLALLAKTISTHTGFHTHAYLGVHCGGLATCPRDILISACSHLYICIYISLSPYIYSMCVLGNAADHS